MGRGYLRAIEEAKLVFDKALEDHLEQEKAKDIAVLAIKRLEDSGVIDMPISTHQASQILRLHYNTINRYIKCGLIPKHSKSTDRKIYIPLRFILNVDYENLKRKYRYGR